MAIKSKTSVKHKSAVKPNKKTISKQAQSQREAALETLRQSEERYRSILEEMQEGYFEVDLAGNFTFFNNATCRVMGYSKEEMTGMNDRQYTDKENAKILFQAFNEVYRTGNPSKAFDWQVISKDGTKRFIEISASLKKDSSGNPIGFRGAARDITERKQAESQRAAALEALRQSEEKYRTILENIEDGYYEVDLAGNLTFFNNSMCRIWGYPKEELTGMNSRQYTDKQNAKMLFQTFNEVYRTGNPAKAFDWQIINKDGTKRYIEASVSLLKDSSDKPTGFRGIVRDVTERKLAEEALRDSEEKYRTILENMQEGYFEVDLAGNFTFFNDSAGRVIGYPIEEMMGMNSRQYTDKAEAKKLFQTFNEVYKTGNPSKAFDWQIIGKDGIRRYIEVSVSSRKDSSGKPIGFRGIGHDITERKQAEAQREAALEALRQSEERYRSILEEMQEGYFEVDLAGNFTFFNNATCRVMGYSKEEMTGMNDRQYTDKENAKILFQAFNEVYRTGNPSKAFDWQVISKDGTKRFIEISASLKKDSSGNPIGFRGAARDITERKQAESQRAAALEALRQSEEKYRTILENIEDGYYEVDLTGNFTFFNDSTCLLLGYSPEEMVGMNNRQYTDRENSKILFQAFNEVYRTGEPAKEFAWQIIRKDGTKRFLESSISLIKDSSGNPIGFRGVTHDVTKRKLAEEKIQYMATHDSLTGLPNRMMFTQLLSHALQAAKRYQKQCAVLFMDLDRFKIINDTMGHDAGDLLLQVIASRLKQTLRSADVVARLGGDEFVILVEEVSNLSQLEVVAKKILSAIIDPISIFSEECRVTGSIGISVFPRDAEDEQTLMKHADSAMYFAKEEGKNNFKFYSTDIKSQSIERLSIETHLRFALERNELTLAYQAKLDFKTNSITGVEALLRWNNPALGSVTPTQFISVAEETGLIVPIGRWVMKTACTQNVAWQKQGLPLVCMAVNLSLRQLLDDNLIVDIRKALTDSGMAPNLLELEITESMVMHNPEQIITTLTKIKSLGVRLAIDDFGTGYSSLSQIKHFPVDTLKIDRSFIRNIPKDSEDKAITEAIIAMGKTLSLAVVAEGVETQEQMDFLLKHSCDEMQGFYFSKPLAPEMFAELLRGHNPSLQK